MKCPACGAAAKCTDSRDAPENRRRRRYVCRCGVKFSTLEEIATTGDYVRKRGLVSEQKRRWMDEAKVELRDKLDEILR